MPPERLWPKAAKAVLGIFSVSLLLSAPVLAEEKSSTPEAGLLPIAGPAAQEEQPIDYTGDKISYDQANNILRGDGHVIITFKNMSLKADRVIAYLATSDAYADGNVVLTVGNQVFTGEKVHFNFKSRLGDFINGTGYVNPWYGKGKIIRKAGPNEYQIEDGYITSCNYEDPHYKIKAKKIYVFPKDRLVAKGVIFTLGKWDLLWFPLFARSLKDERQRFTIIPGYNKKLGAFIRFGYNFWLDPYLSGTVHTDYYGKRGFGTGVDFGYQISGKGIKYPMEGKFRSYIIDDRDYQPSELVVPGVDTESPRHRIELKHEQQIFSDTRALLEVHKLSDPDIVNDFFREQFEDEVQPRSYLDIAKTTENWRLGIIAQKRINDIYTELERLPEVQFQTRTLPVGDTGLFYTSSSTGGYYQFVPLQADDYDSLRGDTHHELSYPFKVFRWLNIEPRVGIRETYYSEGANDEDNVFRTIFNTGVDLFTKLSKVYPNVKSDFWQINGLRHLIEPRIGYTLVPPPTKRPSELLQFDGVDNLDKQNFFRVSLRNKLQTRRENRTVDLVDVEIFTNYHPNLNAPSLDRFGEAHPFSDIFIDSRFRPLDWVAIDFRGGYDEYNQDIDQLLLDVALINGDAWNISFRQRLQAAQNNLTALEILYRFNQDWIGKAFWRYDFEFGKLEEQEYSILRDLHCWEMALTFRERQLVNDLSLFVIFRLKDYPGVPIKFGN